MLSSHLSGSLSISHATLRLLPQTAPMEPQSRGPCKEQPASSPSITGGHRAPGLGKGLSADTPGCSKRPTAPCPTLMLAAPAANSLPRWDGELSQTPLPVTAATYTGAKPGRKTKSPGTPVLPSDPLDSHRLASSDSRGCSHPISPRQGKSCISQQCLDWSYLNSS
ncbi:hypothetical protein KIL84_011826 [Mauremys mutica]|uniref:Uncharacterized protein n=1 Tax=Mauremys mutica TaxID=74926 RepID=A0A9D4B2D9_9SAUR|nr:hypothetical protein KIL84_011826 [Mauremys mutica]